MCLPGRWHTYDLPDGASVLCHASARDKISADRIAMSALNVYGPNSFRILFLPLEPLERLLIGDPSSYIIALADEERVAATCSVDWHADATARTFTHFVSRPDRAKWGPDWIALAVVPNSPPSTRLCCALFIAPRTHLTIPFELSALDTDESAKKQSKPHSLAQCIEDFYVDEPLFGSLVFSEVDDAPDWSHVAIASARDKHAYTPSWTATSGRPLTHSRLATNSHDPSR
jgi:hypothetical protein